MNKARHCIAMKPVARQIAFIYAILSGVWILGSDRLLFILTHDSEFITQIQTLKGCFFVLLSSLLIYGLVRKNWQDLRESYCLIEAVIGGTTDAIFVKDLQGCYILANATTGHILGKPISEILNRDDTEFLSPYAAQEVMTTDQFIMRTGRSQILEETITVNHQTRTYLSTKDVYRNPKGKVIGLIGISRDITERKKAQEEYENLVRTLIKEREDLAVLNAITENGISTLNLEDLMQTLLSRIVSLTKADKGMILLKVDEHLSVRASVGLEAAVAEHFNVRIGQGFSGQIAASLAPFYVEDAQTSPIVVNRYVKQSGIRSMLGVPLARQGHLVGVLHIDWEIIHPYSDREVHLLEIVAERCTMAILNAQLYEETKQLKDHLQLQIERMPIGLLITDRNFHCLDWNPASERIFGYTQAEVLGKLPHDLIIPPSAQAEINQILARLAEGDMTAHSVSENLTKDGRRIICEWYNTPLRSADGTVTGFLSMVQDVSDRIRAEAALRKSEERLRTIIENMPVLMDAFDPQGNLIAWNQECERVTGYSAAEMLGNPQAMELLYPDFTYRHQMVAQWSERGNHYRNWEWDLTCKNGQQKTVAWSNMSDEFPIPGWASWGIGVDVSDRKRIEEQLRYIAFYDPLTRLPNRTLCLQKIAEKIAPESENLESFALLLIDLEQFPLVKYSLGHLMADQLLKVTASRLQQCLPPGDMIARVGTHEFALLLDQINNLQEVDSIVQNIYQAIAASEFDLEGRGIFSNVNIGIVFSGIGYQQPEEFLRAADSAAYQAKLLRSSHPVVFDPTMHERILIRLQLETELRHAIETNGFQVFYQPIISLKTGELIGFEALIRWTHPTQGNISPEEFIYLAEERGLIEQIDRWVLWQACQQLKQWQQEFLSLDKLIMSVNFSGQNLSKLGLSESLNPVLEEIGIKAENLKLEITESAIGERVEIAKLETLRNLGIQLSIDDFGTGYSSLARLHQLPIDTLKIDRSFIHALGRSSESSLEIVKTIITLAHSLEMDVIAEGVETQEQMQILRDLNCEYAQGYFFSRPVDSQTAQSLLRAEFQV